LCDDALNRDAMNSFFSARFVVPPSGGAGFRLEAKLRAMASRHRFRAGEALTRSAALLGAALLLAATTVIAQPQFPGNRWSGWANENDLGGSLVRTEGSGVIDEDFVKTA